MFGGVKDGNGRCVTIRVGNLMFWRGAAVGASRSSPVPCPCLEINDKSQVRALLGQTCLIASAQFPWVGIKGINGQATRCANVIEDGNASQGQSGYGLWGLRILGITDSFAREFRSMRGSVTLAFGVTPPLSWNIPIPARKVSSLGLISK